MTRENSILPGVRGGPVPLDHFETERDNDGESGLNECPHCEGLKPPDLDRCSSCEMYHGARLDP